ncbi:hypothetical protein SELMODRAFT_427617 [Selaginella moellendorffii]|uniref:Uncharacterized protein n=1 Tax=Selaginella moellendorffii TaxID=88036 RepID=D8T066_SELML|nr:hypothetical protein SELMODRAFT_427617 [Selaginella moellendorffii]
MDTQINISVIEAIGTSALEAAAIGGGVLASNVGGGGVVMPLVVEVARGKVTEPIKEVIGSIIDGSTTEATGGMVATPTTPQAGGEGLCMHDSDTIMNDLVWDTIIQAQEWTLVQNHWMRLAYELNMATCSSFAKVGFGSTAGTFIVSPTFPRTSRTKPVTTELKQK